MLTEVAQLAKLDLLNQLQYLTAEDQHQVNVAAEFADHAHKYVTRKSGEPYILHPLAVARILSELNIDAESLCAALLHDVIEDTEITKSEIIESFNEKIAELVDGVTKLKSSHDKRNDKIASLRKILSATLKEPRVIVIKLADRLHNMSTLDALRPDKRVRIAKETIDIFIPMARLIGLTVLGDELERLCFEHLEPELFQILTSQLEQKNVQRLITRQHWQDALKQYIFELHIKAIVSSRNNEHYIFQHFFKHEQDLESLLETYAFEIVTESIEDCDRLADFLQSQFDWSNLQDHIRKPLPGGHQSLILSLGDSHSTLNITIQTKRMQQATKLGIVLGDSAPETTRSVIQASLTNLSDYLSHDGFEKNNADEVIHGIVQHLHRKKVLAYTPKGKTQELPKGATLIDFAYAISTSLGNHAVGALVDGVPRPLATLIANGQIIEIITDSTASPNPAWLGMVNTPKARHAIQKTLANLSTKEQQDVGRQTLNRALRMYDRDIRDLTDQDWNHLLEWQHLTSVEQLFEQIAIGNVLPQFVASKYLNEHHENTHDQRQLIKGSNGIELRYAQCCTPILGDTILGHLTKKGLVIHRIRCSNIQHEQHHNPTHVVALAWQDDLLEDPRFTVTLQCDMTVNAEQTTEVIFLIQALKAGVGRFELKEKTTLIEVIVRDRNHLAKVIKELRIYLNFPKILRLLSS